MEVLRTAASLMPVPLVKEALGVALSLIQAFEVHLSGLLDILLRAIFRI